MSTRAIAWLLVASLLAGGCGGQGKEASAAAIATAPAKTTTFSAAELNQFLDAARVSDAITDPMQRCITYPDPPGSHWSHAAAAAYCRFNVLPTFAFADVQKLIRAGHADEVERRLAAALLQQQSHTDPRGQFDNIYDVFDNASPEVRATLDAWKLQSPKSAYAYAASGNAYLEAAREARGSAYAEDTPQSNIDSMNHFLALARAELTAAAELDPHLIPVYWSLLDAARLDGNRGAARAAIAKGMQADPADYRLFALRMVQASPMWGGSVKAMEEVAALAREHAASNPLLLLLQPEPGAYAADLCGCYPSSHSAPPEAYRTVFDQVAAVQTLNGAAFTAQSNHRPELALVYFTEALRFNPTSQRDRTARISVLSDLAKRPLLHDAASRFVFAELDRMAKQDATKPWALAEKGQVLIDLQKWDDAWAYADSMIQAHPDDLNGWEMRAMIQSSEPRAGLQDTAKYIIAHFSDRTDQQARSAVAQAHLDLASAASASGYSLPGK